MIHTDTRSLPATAWRNAIRVIIGAERRNGPSWLYATMMMMMSEDRAQYSQTAPGSFCRLHITVTHTGFFIQGAATQTTTGSQAQYRQTNEDGIVEANQPDIIIFFAVLRQTSTALRTCCQVRRADGSFENTAQLFQGYRVIEGVLPADPDSHGREPLRKISLSALNICLYTAWRRAQDREQWQRTIEAAMLQHGVCLDDDESNVHTPSQGRQLYQSPVLSYPQDTTPGSGVQ